MRALTEQEIAVINSRDGYSVGVRVWLWDGATFQDLSTLVGRNWLVSVEWDEAINEPCAQATVTLRRRLEDFSLNPLVSNALTGVLALARPFYIETATVPLGGTPTAGDWVEVFRGRVEEMALDKDPMTFTGRDGAGVLMHTFIETEREYGSDAGVAVETVMQSILTDNSTGVTLHHPTATTVVLGKYKAKKSSVLSAVRERALGIGWDVRMWWDDVTEAFRLTLLLPNRTDTVTRWTFQPWHVRAVTKLGQSMFDVRNKGALFYYNRSAVDAGGKPTLASVTASDATSITKYGTLYMQLAEDENSPIDSPTEAQALLDAAIADLKEPLLDFGVTVGFHYGVQLNDMLTFVGDGQNFTADQTLAVVSIAHSIGPRGHKTTLSLRGKPIGAQKSWLARESRVQPRQPRTSAPATVTGLTATATTSGVVVTFTAPTAPPLPAEYELHISTSTGFTISTSTLRERANRTRFEVTGLTPGTTYYVKVVPRDGVGNRGTASSEASVTPRYMEPRLLQPRVTYAALPLNADFEAHNDTSVPPDGWALATGTWGSTALATTDSFSGGNAIQFVAGSASTITAQLVSIRPGQTYCARAFIKAAGATTSLGTLFIRWYSTVGGSGTLSAGTNINATGGTWTEYRCFEAAPSTARYAEVLVSINSSAAVDTYIDSTEILPTSLPQRPWLLVGASVGGGYSVAYSSGWTNWGGGYGDVGFRINSLGNLEFKGMAKASTPAPAANATMFTLPSGYRPAANHLVRMHTAAAGDLILVVSTTGAVDVSVIGAGDFLSFAGISVPMT